MDNFDINLTDSVWGSLFGSPDAPVGDPPVIGFRICKIDWNTGNGPRLHGIGMGAAYKWMSGENIAGCASSSVRTMKDMDGNFITQGHQAPQLHCGCGLHACTDLTTLDTVTHGLKQYADRNHVIAGVLGWGRVLEFEKGFRAEKAEIVAICDAFPGKVIKDTNGKVIKILSKKIASPDALEQLSKYYHCPVVGLRDLESVVREHGSSLGE